MQYPFITPMSVSLTLHAYVIALVDLFFMTKLCILCIIGSSGTVLSYTKKKLRDIVASYGHLTSTNNKKKKFAIGYRNFKHLPKYITRLCLC
jgi:hypothetical protein